MRRKIQVKSLALVLSLVLFIVLAVLVSTAFIIMLLSGAIGHAFDAPSFFINFWQATLVVIALAVVGSFFGRKGN